MKKSIYILFSIFLIISLTVMGYAEQSLAGNSYSFMPDVDGTKKIMIHNDYYKLYYNDIFEEEIANLKNYSMDGMTEQTVSVLTNENYIYATIILKANKTDDYSQYNKSVLATVLDDVDMLFIGDTTPFTVVKLTKENTDKLLKNEQVEGIFPAFFPANILANGIVGENMLGDVTDTPDVTSADARFLLRFSAGLETVSRNNAKTIYLCGDMNFDGKINSADARIALRTAAKLEKKSTITFGSADNWNDFA